ncbi:MAG TPA: hypothetical protein VKY85_26525 [Candidatus Angelobacter sp.]|nr:hypothetical protein [Candidatus Angelobacter sp.]
MSRTAVGVGILRALHELCDDSPRILNDPIIPLLLGDDVVQSHGVFCRKWRKSFIIGIGPMPSSTSAGHDRAGGGLTRYPVAVPPECQGRHGALVLLIVLRRVKTRYFR